MASKPHAAEKEGQAVRETKRIGNERVADLEQDRGADGEEDGAREGKHGEHHSAAAPERGSSAPARVARDERNADADDQEILQEPEMSGTEGIALNHRIAESPGPHLGPGRTARHDPSPGPDGCHDRKDKRDGRGERYTQSLEAIHRVPARARNRHHPHGQHAGDEEERLRLSRAAPPEQEVGGDASCGVANRPREVADLARRVRDHRVKTDAGQRGDDTQRVDRWIAGLRRRGRCRAHDAGIRSRLATCSRLARRLALPFRSAARALSITSPGDTAASPSPSSP